MKSSFCRMGLLVALVLLVPAVAPAQGAAAHTPKLIDVGTGDRWQRLEARLPLMRELAPAQAAELERVLGSAKSARNLSPAPFGPAAGYGFSEGHVDEVATNGKVVAWANDTFFGQLTFAKVDDLAHPVAFVPDAGVWTLPSTLQFDGDTLYVNAITRILAFDCSNPDDIKLKATFDTSCYSGNLDSIQTLYTNDIRDFRVRDGLLYAALGQAGFVVYDVNVPQYPVLAANPLLVSAADNPDFATLKDAYFYNVEVTDTTLILVGGHASGTYPTGEIWTWDIRDRSDPTHTFHLWQQPKGYTNPYQPTVGGNPILFNSLDAQFQYAGGSLFASTTRAQADGYGLARIAWSDVTRFDTLQPKAGLAVQAVNDGTTGPAKLVKSFHASADGSTVWVAFRFSPNLVDYSSMPDSVAAVRWDWSTFDAPKATASYVTDRFFYDDTQALNTKYGQPPPKLSWVAEYGGNGLAVMPEGSATEVFLAAYDYVGAFDATAKLVGHYTTGANYLRMNSPPNPPAGASLADAVATPDGKTVLWWYPETVGLLDVASGRKVGSWEVPDNQDFVRNVALTDDGHYALVSCGSLGLVVLDLSDPAQVQQVAQWWTNPAAPAGQREPVLYAFTHAGHAYVETRAADHNVVRVLDLKNPAQPSELAAYPYAVGDGTAGTVFWDVHQMAVVEGANGAATLLVANGQGRDDGLAFNALYGNSSADLTVSAPAGSVVLADVSNAAALAQLRNLPVTVGTQGRGAYSRMISVAPDTGTTPRYAYLSAGKVFAGADRPYAGGVIPHFPIGASGVGGLVVLDVSDPAAISEVTGLDQLGTTKGLHIDKAYAVRGAAQLVVGTDDGGFTVYDLTNPLQPTKAVLPEEGGRLVAAGYHFTQLPDDSWLVVAKNTGNLWRLVNDPDTVAPTFAPVNDNPQEWLSDTCTQDPCGELDGPLDLTVKVTDNVAVTRVTFYAVFANSPGSPDQPWNACSPGYLRLGDGTKQADDTWTLTVGPGDFHWTGQIFFAAQAFDAGGNTSSVADDNGRWFVAGLQAEAAASPATGTAPLEVKFEGGAQGVRGPFLYAWDFGDGSTSTAQSPSHLYEQPGPYAAKLTVTDVSGRTAVTTVAITANAPEALTAAATASVEQGAAPLKVDFHGAAAGGTGSYTYAWNFGDGSAQAAGVDVSHTFASAGEYTVTLTVTDEGGHSASATVKVSATAAETGAKAGGCGCASTGGSAELIVPALLGLLLLRRRRLSVR